MGFPDVIVAFLCVYYTLHILKLVFFPVNRKSFQERNKQLNTLRSKPVKSMEEQKKFIDLKFGKLEGKQKFKWKKLPLTIVYLICFILLIRGYLVVFSFFNIEFTVFWMITIVIIGPALINLILKKFGVETDDITIFFRGARKQ